MNHKITVEGKVYYTAQLVDSYTDESHDITVIMQYNGALPESIIDYYYGEPNVDTTTEYVKLSLNKKILIQRNGASWLDKDGNGYFFHEDDGVFISDYSDDLYKIVCVIDDDQVVIRVGC